MKLCVKTLKHKCTYLHMLSQTGRMGVRLVASSDFAIIGLVRCMNMTVFLSVTRVGESSITSLKFTTKWFFTCNRRKGEPD